MSEFLFLFLLFEKLINDFFQSFQNFLEKNCYTYYILKLKFLYILFKISVVRTKNFLFFFNKLKNIPLVFLKLSWIPPVSLKFPEIFLTIYSKLLEFSSIFSHCILFEYKLGGKEPEGPNPRFNCTGTFQNFICDVFWEIGS